MSSAEWVIEIKTEQDFNTVWIRLNDGDSDYTFPSREVGEKIIARLVKAQPGKEFRVKPVG